MAVAPMDEDSYPEPVMARPSSNAALWRVVVLSLAFVAVAVAFSLMGEAISPEMIVLFLGVLSVIGVFSLFALAAGLFRFVGGSEKRTLARAIVDSLPYGAVVTDRDGKIFYANAQYSELSKSVSKGVPVGVPRLFASQPEASEAVYRLSRAARDGRAIVEDVRISRGKSAAQWFRIGARALPDFDGAPGKSVIWTVDDITRDRDAQENFYVELQKAIDYLDHAPAGFFSANARGRIQYINSTLADWLGYDLAAFEAGDLDLGEIVQGDGAGLLMGGGQDGAVRTEVIDLDLVRRQRETGMRGLGQVLKSFRDRPVDFPVYDRASGTDAYLYTLGPLEMPAKGTQAGLDTSEPKSALTHAAGDLKEVKLA